jgi:hypothetical protein
MEKTPISEARAENENKKVKRMNFMEEKISREALTVNS